jgi:hypothetical protein
MQIKFDIAEFLLNNKVELLDIIRNEVKDISSTEAWFFNNGLSHYYVDAFEDFVVHKVRLVLEEKTSFTFQEIDESVDKGFLVDLLGNDILNVEGWKNEQNSL